MDISEQVKEQLRELADDMEKYVGLRPKPNVLRNAANIIESLSAKLQAANTDRSAKCYIRNGEVCYLIRDMMLELESFSGHEELIKRAKKCLEDMKRPERCCHGSKNSDDVERILNALDDIWTYGEEPTEEIRMAVGDAIDIIQNMERSAEDCGGWITDRVPTKEECGDSLLGKEFAVTVDSDGRKTMVMDFVYETVRGKEVARWKWKDRISPWEVIAWHKLPEPYH